MARVNCCGVAKGIKRQNTMADDRTKDRDWAVHRQRGSGTTWDIGKHVEAMLYNVLS